MEERLEVGVVAGAGRVHVRRLKSEIHQCSLKMEKGWVGLIEEHRLGFLYIHSHSYPHIVRLGSLRVCMNASVHET